MFKIFFLSCHVCNNFITGTIRVNHELDRERVSQYNLIVYATDMSSTNKLSSSVSYICPQMLLIWLSNVLFIHVLKCLLYMSSNLCYTCPQMLFAIPSNFTYLDIKCHLRMPLNGFSICPQTSLVIS